MERRVVIVGAGISGLVTGWILSRVKDVKVTVVEPDQVGGEFLAGGLRVIRKTRMTESFLEDLSIPFSEFSPKVGILLRGVVFNLQKFLRDCPRKDLDRIRRDYWKKTHLATAPVRFQVEWEKRRPSRFLRCDIAELVSTLSSRFEVYKAEFKDATSERVRTDRQELDFDFLVLTIPLWELREKLWFDVPESFGVKLNLTEIVGFKDPYVRWDYVFTPYTPADCVHRFSTHGGGYVLESSGEFDLLKLESDAGFLFPNGHYVRWGRRNLKGYVLPLEDSVPFPWNAAVVGRFAQCSDGVHVAEVLDRAIWLRKHWFGV